MSGEGGRRKLLVVRGSFATAGGAERELLTVLREWSLRWEVTLATLQFPAYAREMVDGLDIQIITPATPFSPNMGALSEIFGGVSKAAERAWGKIAALREAIEDTDVVHLSVSRGTLEILPLLPDGLGVHYHCLEAPRWLYEDVLHRRLDGAPKRPLWLTRLIFRKQRKRDTELVRRLLLRRGAAISGNSHWTQSRLSSVYRLPHHPSLANGEPPPRENGRCMGVGVLMHVVDLSEWPREAVGENIETPDAPGKYVITVGRISHVKGTWETLHSLQGSGLGLVQVGGGADSDRRRLENEAEKIGVELVCMPRLSQAQLRKLVRAAVAMVSHAHGEPFGLTPIEAMAVGTPALFVDEGGFRDTMGGAGSGLLIPRHDKAAWRAAYLQAQDAKMREEWAEKGRQVVEEGFSLKLQADALARLLEDCIQHSQ